MSVGYMPLFSLAPTVIAIAAVLVDEMQGCGAK
jgi:hypothetical protein